jgi:colicin import membrane protein
MDAPRHDPTPTEALSGGTPADPEVLRLITDVESQLQGLKRIHAERDNTRARLDQRQAELDAQHEQQASLAAQLAQREQEAQREAEALRERQAQAEQLARELAELERDSKDRMSRAAEERQTIEAIATELGAREKVVAERSARLDQLQQEVRALKQRLAETERIAAERSQELLRSQDDATDLARRLEELERSRPSAERQIASLTTELERAAETARRAETDLAERQRSITELTERCTALEQRLAEQGSRHSVSAEAAAELDARLRAAAEELAQATTERDQSREELARHQQQGAELAGRLAAAGRDLKQAAAAREESSAALAKAAAHSKELASRLAALQEQAEGLRKQASGRAAKAGAQAKLRRERMQRCRFLLRERSMKIRQAGEMLKSRHQQCEQVLSMRGEVLTAKRTVDALQKKVQAASARTRASTALFYLAGLIAVLGVLSWTVTQQVVPATYTAKATIVPESRNRTLTDEELAHWQAFHETLLTDPQFIELAAERMGRRGIAILATPGDLKEELDLHLDAQSPKDGQLVLELRGLGSERTARVLDTYVTALVSQANAAKEHRTDGASTAILEPARASRQPIEDPRPVFAAGVLGGSTVVFLIIGAIIWQRLAAAKTRFETEANIDELVESPNWPASSTAG